MKDEYIIKGVRVVGSTVVNITVEGRRIPKRVPNGWRLVTPDESIDETMVVAYSSRGSECPFEQPIDRNPIGYWTTINGKNLRKGEVYKDSFNGGDLWRLIAPERLRVARPDPALARYEEGSQLALLTVPTVMPIRSDMLRRFSNGSIIEVTRDGNDITVTTVIAQTMAEYVNGYDPKLAVDIADHHLEPMHALPFKVEEDGHDFVIRYATGYVERIVNKRKN